MPYYDHICDACGVKVEDTNPSPPSCSAGHGLMRRKYTPSAVIVKGGTPRFHGNEKRERHAKWKDDRSEEEHQDRQVDADIARIDEQAKRDYSAGELSYKHGHGSFDEERQMAKEDAAKGQPHGAVEE